MDLYPGDSTPAFTCAVVVGEGKIVLCLPHRAVTLKGAKIENIALGVMPVP